MTKGRLEILLYNTIKMLEYYEPEDTEKWICEETGMTSQEYRQITSTMNEIKLATKKEV